MKVKVFSEKGIPINKESSEKYSEEFKKLYDSLWKLYESKEMDIEEFKTNLDKEEKILQSKYPMYDLVELPKSVKKWKELVIKYERPIMLGINSDDKSLCIIVLDSTY